MKTPHAHLIGLLVGFGFVSPLYCAPPSSLAVGPQIAPEKTSSKWSIRAGATTRRVETSFRVAAPSFAVPGLGRRGGINPGLSLAGIPGPDYEDGTFFQLYRQGFIGGQYYQRDGDWVAGFISLDQVVFSGRTYVLSDAGGPESEIAYIYDLNYSSFGGTESRTFATGGFQDLEGSDSEVGVGPTVEVSYEIFSTKNASAFVNIGYAFVPTSHGIRGSMGRVDVFRQQRNVFYNYRYDAVSFREPFAPDTVELEEFPPPYPTGEYFLWYAIVNPELAAGDPDNYYSVREGDPNPFLAPSKTRTQSSSTKYVTRYEATGYADLDVNLHEIALTGSLLFALNDYLSVGGVVGPTFNMVDTSFTSGVDIRNVRSGKIVASWRDKSNETQFAFGAMADLVVRCNLTKSGQWYAQLQGGYRWVEDVTVSNAMASAKVDLSDFSGTALIGFDF